MVFGQGILEYTMSLCQGHYDYLERLSDTLLLRIVKHLEIEDIGQLGRTSRRFHKVSNEMLKKPQTVSLDNKHELLFRIVTYFY